MLPGSSGLSQSPPSPPVPPGRDTEARNQPVVGVQVSTQSESEGLPPSKKSKSEWSVKIKPAKAFCEQILPPGFFELLRFDKKGLLVVPLEHHQALVSYRKHPDKAIPSALMSPSLLPALENILFFLNSEKLPELPKEPGSKDLGELIFSYLYYREGLTLIDINSNLQLCHIALSDRSPLKRKQKIFLANFLAKQIPDKPKALGCWKCILKCTKIEPLIDAGTDIAKPCAAADLEKSANSLLADLSLDVTWKNINERLLSGPYEEQPRSPFDDKYFESLWAVLVTFRNFWSMGQACDLASEFNYGDPQDDNDDMLKPELLSVYLRVIFAGTEALEPAQKALFALLMDAIVHHYRLRLTMDGKPVNWREWARRFKPGEDSVPPPPPEKD